jgi:hypothetical protein
MKKFTIEKPSTVRDLAIKLYGSWQHVFKLANENGLTIDTIPAKGTVISYDETFGDLKVKNKISNENLEVTNNWQNSISGINFWGIEFDFVVS